MAFIDAHRGEFGVEPICAVLREHGVGIAPNTYHVARNRPRSRRAVRDEELKVQIHDIFEGTEQIQQLVISRAISGMRIE